MKKVNIIKQFHGGSMASTFLIRKENGLAVRKVAVNSNDGLGSNKLMSQWRWLYEASKKNPGIFPETSLFVFSQDYCHYDMEYLEMDTLRDLLIRNEPFNPELITVILQIGGLIASPVLNYNQDKTKYVEKFHLQKMLDRTECLDKFGIRDLDEIFINGKKQKNLKTLIKEIRDDKKLMKYLQPKQWYVSHGDYTFQNILTDEYDICVIDPRGEGPDTIYYDISKLFQSVHGKYDLLYHENYSVDTGQRTDTINYKIHNNVEKFDLIYAQLLDLIPEYYDIQDEHWKLIAKFYEASHFISMAPFRLKENNQITAVCYAIGIEILNEVLEEWRTINEL